jgi:competence protein ComGC
MKTYSNKAFAFVEVMIVAFIIGSLVVLFAPITIKMKEVQLNRFERITYQLQNGENISFSDVEFYNKNFEKLSESHNLIALEEAREKANSLKKTDNK